VSVQVLKRVFGDPRYLVVALASAVFVFIFATWLPNLSLAWQVIASASVPLAVKVQILSGLVGSIATNFTLFSALSLITIALLFGANVAMVAYRLNVRRQIIDPGQSGVATSLGGLASGLAGVGCGTCGTFVLGPVLSLVGAGGLLSLLPFGGEELTILGICMLALSLHLAGKGLVEPLTCSVGSDSKPGLSRMPSRAAVNDNP
jgi:hypothetical protein